MNLTINESQALLDVLNDLDHQIYCTQKIKLKNHIQKLKDNATSAKYHIEEINQLSFEINQLNDFKLDEIEIYENGHLIEIPKKIIDDFRVSGLNNLEFISSGFYKTGFTEVV